MRKILHVSYDIAGCLKRAEDFIGCLQTEDGRTLSDIEEIKAVFKEELARGHRLLPAVDCKNFDTQRGCLGCEAEEVSPSDISGTQAVYG